MTNKNNQIKKVIVVFEDGEVTEFLGKNYEFTEISSVRDREEVTPDKLVTIAKAIKISLWSGSLSSEGITGYTKRIRPEGMDLLSHIRNQATAPKIRYPSSCDNPIAGSVKEDPNGSKWYYDGKEWVQITNEKNK